MTPEERARRALDAASCEEEESGLLAIGYKTALETVADAIRQAVAEKCEACAQLAKELAATWNGNGAKVSANAANCVADAIRARGGQTPSSRFVAGADLRKGDWLTFDAEGRVVPIPEDER